MKLDMKISLAITAAAVAAMAIGSVASADTSRPSAVTPPTTTPPAVTHNTFYGCVMNSRNPANRSLQTVTWHSQDFVSLGGCPAGTTAIAWNATGPQGVAGPKGDTGTPGTNGTNGAKGDTGAAGPSGVQALATNQLTPTSGIVTGGGFVSNATEVGTASLDAGTYQLCVNAKAEQPTAATGSVSAQLFVYDQAKNGGFAGDLLNVSADTQGGTHHDAYLNGCTLITESASVTLHIYGFGYDSDQGSGSWDLMNGTITTIKLTPAS